MRCDGILNRKKRKGQPRMKTPEKHQQKIAFIALLVMLLAGGTGYFMYLKMPVFIIMLLVLTGSVAIGLHVHETQENEFHMINCFGGQPGRGRIKEYDLIRITATILVIATHTIDAGIAEENNEVFRYTLVSLSTVTRCCNYLFVMLSGALLLEYREEKLSHFYFRRFSRVIIPMIIYYTFYLWMNRSSFFPGTSFLQICNRMLTGNTVPEAPHFHLMYTILSLYISFPFMRYLLKAMPYRRLTMMVIIILGFLGLKLFVPQLGVSTFLTGWIGIAVLGYWVTREETGKYHTALIILGVVHVGITFYVCAVYDDCVSIVYDRSPIMSFVSLGIMAVVYKLRRKKTEISWGMRFINRYSYPIILVHWWALYWITIAHFHIDATDWYGLGLIVSTLVTLIVSAFAAFAADNLFVLPVQKALDACFHAISVRRCLKRQETSKTAG